MTKSKVQRAPNPSPLATLAAIADMTEAERLFACAAINRFGTHDHPMATPDGLHFFQRDYIRECAEKAQRLGGLTEIGERLASNVVAII